MVRICFEFDNTPEDFDTAVALLETLRRKRAEPAPNPAVEQSPATQPVVDYKVSDWFSHLGDGSRSFWLTAARYSQANPSFTFDDLAQVSSDDKATLRSYHRNSYRAIRAVGADDPLYSEWDAENSYCVYVMPDVVRDEILRLTTPPDTAEATETEA